MPTTDDQRARERAHLMTVATIIDLAEDDLPEVAALATDAAVTPLGDDIRTLLERAYDLAFDAGHEYLAELLDLALAQIEPRPPA